MLLFCWQQELSSGPSLATNKTRQQLCPQPFCNLMKSLIVIFLVMLKGASPPQPPPSWHWCGGAPLRRGALLQHCGMMEGVREWEGWKGEKLVAVPPNCSPTSVLERAKSCLELRPWGRRLVLSSLAAAPGLSPQSVNLKGILLCFDSVHLSFDVRAIHPPVEMMEDARAVVKPPERGREALGTVPEGADEQRDGVGGGCAVPGGRVPLPPILAGGWAAQPDLSPPAGGLGWGHQWLCLSCSHEAALFKRKSDVAAEVSSVEDEITAHSW